MADNRDRAPHQIVWVVVFEGIGPGDTEIEGIYTNPDAAEKHAAARGRLGKYVRVYEWEVEPDFVPRDGIGSLVYNSQRTDLPNA